LFKSIPLKTVKNHKKHRAESCDSARPPDPANQKTCLPSRLPMAGRLAAGAGFGGSDLQSQPKPAGDFIASPA
jgi:hypothetical protein